MLQRFVRFRRGRLRTHTDEPHFEILQNPFPLCRFAQIHRITGRGDQSGHAEILHQHQLPLRIARRHGNDRCAQFFDAVMQAETARKQAVAERDLKNIFIRRPRHGQKTGKTGGPVVEVAPRISARDRFARRAAGSVDADDLFHRYRIQAERIMVAQVVFGRIRYIFEIFESFDVFGLQADRVEALPVHGHVFICVADSIFQPLQLHFFQRLSVDRFYFGTEHRLCLPFFPFKYIDDYFITFCRRLQSYSRLFRKSAQNCPCRQRSSAPSFSDRRLRMRLTFPSTSSGESAFSRGVNVTENAMLFLPSPI